MRPSMPVVVLCFQHIHELWTLNESRLATTSRNFLRTAKWGAIMTAYESGIHNIRGIQDIFFKQKASRHRGPFIPGKGWISRNWNFHPQTWRLDGWTLHFCGSMDLCCVLWYLIFWGLACAQGTRMNLGLAVGHVLFQSRKKMISNRNTGNNCSLVSAIMKWSWNVSIEFYVNQFMGTILPTGSMGHGICIYSFLHLAKISGKPVPWILWVMLLLEVIS